MMARIKAYFKLDLYFFENPKTVDLSHAATVLYIAAIAHANRRETDGFVHRKVLRRLVDIDPTDDYAPTHAQVAEELVKAELWEPAEEGWQIHDFLEHNDSSQEREDRREQERDRKRRERAAAKDDSDGPEPPSGRPPRSVRPDKSGRPSASEQTKTPGAHIDVDVPEQSRAQGRSTPLSLVPSDAPSPDPVVLVFHAWVASFPDPTRRDLTPARRDAIKAALARYPLDDVRDAVCGWRHDPWPERAQQNDLAQLLHMGSKRKPANILERMRDLQRRGPPVVLGKATAQAKATYDQMMQQWAGGEDGDQAGMGRDRGQAQRELPRPAG